jgi:hypothetical protein
VAGCCECGDEPSGSGASSETVDFYKTEPLSFNVTNNLVCNERKKHRKVCLL